MKALSAQIPKIASETIAGTIVFLIIALIYKINIKQCKNLKRAIKPLVSTVLIALGAQIPKMTLKTFVVKVIFDL